MTSNLGSDLLLGKSGRQKEELTKEVILELLEPILKSHFRPEFFNRLDDILPFLPFKTGRHGKDRRNPARSRQKAA